MKIYKLPQLAEMSPDGEYCLNSEDIKSDAVYLYYGRLAPGEKKRRLTARDGHEEIVYIIKGALTAKHGKTVFQAGAGEAFHCAREVFIDNPNEDEVIYLAAGGRVKEAAKGPKKETSTVTPPPADEEPAPVSAPESPVAEEDSTDNTDDEFIITKD